MSKKKEKIKRIYSIKDIDYHKHLVHLCRDNNGNFSLRVSYKTSNSYYSSSHLIRIPGWLENMFNLAYYKGYGDCREKAFDVADEAIDKLRNSLYR